MKKSIAILSATLLFATPFTWADDHAHKEMDHSSMDHSSMDHSGMSMEGMSDVGMLAPGSQPDKVVYVVITGDMQITFKNEVKIESNDVVQFVVMNKDDVEHQFAIGSEAEHMKQREMIKVGDGHENKHSLTVKPGKAEQILWHFHGEKVVQFACNLPGHEKMVKEINL